MRGDNMYKDDGPHIVVMCNRCYEMARYTPADANSPWGTWHWHEPCKKCGAEDYSSIEWTRYEMRFLSSQAGL